MARLPDQPVVESADATTDSGLRCPQCEYNLTGLTERRCPECGAAFDLEELRDILARKPEPIPGWDDRGTPNVFMAFVRVCWLTWFRPSEFARRFPRTYGPADAMVVWLTARLAAAAVVAAGLALGILFRLPVNPRLFVRALSDASIVIAAGSLACEVLVAITLALLVRPRHKPRAARPLDGSVTGSTGWFGLVAFYGSFLVISTAVAMCLGGVAVAAFPHAGDEAMVRALRLVELGPLAWWSWALGLAVTARAVPSLGLVIARWLIPAIGLAVPWLVSVCCGIYPF